MSVVSVDDTASEITSKFASRKVVFCRMVLNIPAALCIILFV